MPAVFGDFQTIDGSAEAVISGFEESLPNLKALELSAQNLHFLSEGELVVWDGGGERLLTCFADWEMILFGNLALVLAISDVLHLVTDSYYTLKIVETY